MAALLPGIASGQTPADDATLAVLDLSFETARLGENPFEARVRNLSDSTVVALLDLRAVPGAWMIPNIQKQAWIELGPGEDGTIAGVYEFQRLSVEGTLRVIIGPGRRMDWGGYGFAGIDFRETYDVGADSPDAYDPLDDFTRARRGPLEIWAWKGSLAERRLDEIATERLDAVRAIEELLSVEAPDRIRLVFYADEATKAEQTGHQGVGWARGTTLVEVLNDEIRVDPFHELAHVVAGEAGSPPPLLAEGWALYATERLGADALGFLGMPGSALAHVMCELPAASEHIPLEELLALDNIGSEERAVREYAEAGSFVAHLVAAHGLDRFREAYGALEDDAPVEANLERLGTIYGSSLQELEQEWLDGVAARCPG